MRDEKKPNGGAPLDAVSLAIIEQLRADGRRAYASVGKAVGLSEAAVRQRVQRLQDQGVMRIVAVTDPVALGLTRQALVGVTVEGQVQPVADALAELPEVEHVVVTAGSFDLLVEVVCADDEHLLETVGERVRAVPGVRSTESFLYLGPRTRPHTRPPRP